MTKIIGICGLIGSGKDTVAQYLIDSRNFKRISFATKLKDATAIVFGWDRAMLEGATPETRAQREIVDPYWTEKLNRPWSPRIALQFVGTELFREVLDDNIWVLSADREMQLIKSYLDIIDSEVNFVISDCRFPNEIKMIRDNGGEIWRVQRGPLPEWWDCAQLSIQQGKFWNTKREFLMAERFPDVHFSEWAWVGEDFDNVIINDGTLADLYQKVEESISQ